MSEQNPNLFTNIINSFIYLFSLFPVFELLNLFRYEIRLDHLRVAEHNALSLSPRVVLPLARSYLS